MYRFIDGFVQAWQNMLNKLIGGPPDWYTLGAAFAALTAFLGVMFIFAFICLYLPHKWDMREKKKREMDPTNPYHGRGDHGR